MAEFLKIYCNLEKSGKICNAFLGYVQTDSPNVAGFYCRNCGKIHEYEVTEDLEVTHKIVPEDRPINFPESIAVIELTGAKNGD